jgi:hypothetical protein
MNPRPQNNRQGRIDQSGLASTHDKKMPGTKAGHDDWVLRTYAARTLVRNSSTALRSMPD